jgi:hypothetical protein
MGILNRPSDGQLTVLLALSRTLQAYGPMDEERLEALCAPASVVKDRTQVHKTLVRFKQLGLFVDDPRGVRLAAPFDGLDLADVESIRTPLRALVLDERNNPLETQDADEEGGDASDFSLGAAWLLQQDPYTFSGRWEDVELLQKTQTQETKKKFLSNSTRWDGLHEWAPFLGLCRIIGKTIVPNPVHAVHHAIAAVPSGVSLMPIRDFRTILAELVPVVDHGTYWKAAAGRLSHPWLKLDPTDISPSLSLALLQLDHERRIALDRRSDAREVFRLLGRNGGEVQQVTHVSFVMESGL